MPTTPIPNPAAAYFFHCSSFSFFLRAASASSRAIRSSHNRRSYATSASCVRCHSSLSRRCCSVMLRCHAWRSFMSRARCDSHARCSEAKRLACWASKAERWAVKALVLASQSLVAFACAAACSFEKACCWALNCFCWSRRAERCWAGRAGASLGLEDGAGTWRVETCGALICCCLKCWAGWGCCLRG